MKRLLYVSFLIACTNAVAEPSDDLVSLYSKSRANYPMLQQAVAQLGASDAAVDINQAALMPQWTISATPRRTTGVTTSTVTSKISQTIVNLAALDTWRAARADASAQTATLRAIEQALMAEVAVRYFALLTAQSQLDTLAANEAAVAELVRQSMVRVAERLSAAVDVDQARAYLGLAQASTQRAKESLADARQAVQELTGQLPLSLKRLKKGFKPAVPHPTNSDAWVEEALVDNPTLQSGNAGVLALEQRAKATRAANLPTLDVSFTTYRAPIDGASSGRQVTNNTLGLTLTFPIVAGGATFALTRQALYARDAAAAQVEATRRSIIRNVEAQLQTVRGSVAEIAIAEPGAEAAERALSANRAGHQYGTRTLTDVLNAIQTNGQAQLQLTQARHRNLVALLQLKQAVGRLSVDDLVTVNGLLEFDFEKTSRPMP
ncbi:TolC family protein [Janthinobacterium fluminis]|uniref:TolC family protein n=1 Tax=Janthinobacterium fluminis TaxID=2987524 RepID=A0ABT5JXP5_9BURK|nr:TolC family protein [Janthinobacterium fluminis]MDC8756312.1 TolC family protein [Janthinobacterium fluminis]